MAPTPSPDSDFYDIVGNRATIRPNGTDDWDNVQTVFNTLNALSPSARIGSRVTFAGGTFYLSYGVLCRNFSGEIFGAGKGGTTIVYGTVDAPIVRYDATDRTLFGPTGWPSVFLFHETPTSPTPIDLYMHDLSIKGTDAPGYAGYGNVYDAFNLGVQTMVHIMPSHPMMTVFDVAIVLTGSTPTSVGQTNIQGVTVNDAAGVAGTNFVENTDFTVDHAAGTITRLGAGITSGATVYVTYNNGRNIGLTASVAKAKFERCSFKGGVLLRNGIEHYSAQTAINVQQSSALKYLSNGHDAQHLAAFNDAPFSFLHWDLIFDSIRQPINGSTIIRDCDFANTDFGLELNGCDGVPDSLGTNVFPVTALARSYYEVTNCRFFKAGYGQLWFTSIDVDSTTGTDVVISNNTFDTVMGVVFMDSLAHFELSNAGTYDQRGVGFDGAPISLTFNGNTVKNHKLALDQFGGYFLPTVTMFSNAGLTPRQVTRGIVITNNLIECAFTTELSPEISLSAIDGATIVGNKFVTLAGIQAREAIQISDSDNVLIAGNDFSGFAKHPGRADVLLSPGATSAIVHLRDTDIVEDQGTTSLIMGGSKSSIVH